jgi:hypothetical protein
MNFRLLMQCLILCTHTPLPSFIPQIAPSYYLLHFTVIPNFGGLSFILKTKFSIIIAVAMVIASASALPVCCPKKKMMKSQLTIDRSVTISQRMSHTQTMIQLPQVYHFETSAFNLILAKLSAQWWKWRGHHHRIADDAQNQLAHKPSSSDDNIAFPTVRLSFLSSHIIIANM